MGLVLGALGGQDPHQKVENNLTTLDFQELRLIIYVQKKKKDGKTDKLASN